MRWKNFNVMFTVVAEKNVRHFVVPCRKVISVQYAIKMSDGDFKFTIVK